MSKKPSVGDCAGCHDDFYNHNHMGLNVKDGKPRCWSLETAQFVKVREIHVDQRPPYSVPLVTRPSCYRKQRFVMVKPEALTKEGFWR